MKNVSMFKRTVLSVLTFVLAFALMLTCVACDPPAEPVTITLNAQSITIGVGDSKRVQAEVSDGSDPVWTSSNDSVATVSAAGVVRGIAAGEATITATVGDVSASCTVTVQNITISLNKTELTLDIETESKKSETLVATVMNGESVVEETVTWSSSNNEVATVDENGTVTAVGMGTATITAKRANGNATATCEVTVGWENMPDGYTTIGFSEQNKATTNTYGIWNDQGWEFGNTVIYNAWTANSEGSMAGKVFMDYEVLSTMKDEYQAAIQLTLRSSMATGDEGALLEVGYFYTLSLDITSSASGVIHVNDYAVNGEVEGLEDQVYEFEVVAGETTHIELVFAHYDDGRIHDTTDYSNVESALHILLGSLEGRVQVTIDNIQWVKGEQAPERPGGTIQPPVVVVPDLSESEDIALDFNEDNIDHGQAVENGSYAITNNDEGKSYTVDFENAPGGTYENLFASLETISAVAEGNTFSATVTNNGETDVAIRFDLAGIVAAHGSFADARDCAISSVAVDSEGNAVSVTTDTTYDGTMFTVAAGQTVTVYITYTVDGVNGIPTELLVYFNTCIYQDTATYSGNVTIGAFKFAYWEAPEEIPPVVIVPDGESVSLPISNESIDHVNATDGTYGTYDIVDNGDGKSYTIDYATFSSTYENLIVSLENTPVGTNNTFSITITNNGENSIEIRFNINGEIATEDGNGNPLFDCALSSKTTRNDGKDHTDLVYGGTTLQVAAGETVTLIITYANDGAHGVPTELCIYFNTGWYGTADSNWAEIYEERTGDVTLSEFKFANVEANGEQEDVVTAFQATDASLEELNGVAVIAISGTYEAIDGATADAIIADLSTIYFDFQGNPYINSNCSSWDGDWAAYVLTCVGVTIDETAGTYVAKYDLSSLANYAYTGHYGSADSTGDLKPTAESFTKTLTVGTKTYTLSYANGSAADYEFWGCVGLRIADAQ